MSLLSGFESAPAYRGCALAIGNFDGVHRGHQTMIRELVAAANACHGPAVVLTFEPHPIRLLRPSEAPPVLSTIEWKAELLADHGVDWVIAYPTDRAMLSLTPQEFFDRVIVEQFSAKAIVEGPNFCFGKDRAGDVATLRSLAQTKAIAVTIVEPVTDPSQESMVSSSRIRTLITSGEFDLAIQLLGHPYRIQGVVGTGSRRGRQLGFPTANLQGIENLIPAPGVYAGFARVDNRERIAAVHIGGNPTFAEHRQKVEVHLLDFSGDLYGSSLAVELIGRIRGVQKFDSVESLQSQLSRDLRAARDLAASDPC